MATGIRIGAAGALLAAGIGGAQAAPLGIAGYFNPATRIFVPMPLHAGADGVPAAAPATGTLKVAFTIAIKSTLPAGDKITCSATADTFTTTGLTFEDTANVSTTPSGTSASCTVTVPYSWPGITTANTASLIFTLVDTAYARSSSQSFATLKVPANGTVTTYKLTPVF